MPSLSGPAGKRGAQEGRESGARRARSGRANTGEHRVREVRQEVLAAAGERARARGSSWGVSGGEPPAGLRRGALRAASLPECGRSNSLRRASGGRLAAWRCAPARPRPREQPGCVGRGASGGPAARGAARGKLAGMCRPGSLRRTPGGVALRAGAARHSNEASVLFAFLQPTRPFYSPYISRRSKGRPISAALSWQGKGNDQNGKARNAFSERSEHRPLGPPEALRPGASLSALAADRGR